MKKIVLFGNSKQCPACVQMRQYLNAKIGEPNYVYHDLSTDDMVKRIEYKKALHKLGVKMIPALYIDDNDVVLGFGKDQIDKINDYLANRC